MAGVEPAVALPAVLGDPPPRDLGQLRLRPRGGRRRRGDLGAAAQRVRQEFEATVDQLPRQVARGRPRGPQAPFGFGRVEARGAQQPLELLPRRRRGTRPPACAKPGGSVRSCS